MKVDVCALLNSIKHSQWYQVEVDLPSDLTLSGPVPYAIWVHSDGRARVSVLAPDEDTATQRVYQWLNGLNQDS